MNTKFVDVVAYRANESRALEIIRDFITNAGPAAVAAAEKALAILNGNRRRLLS